MRLTQLVRKYGAGIRLIQMMLGHAQLGTTQTYTHASIRQLQEIHARTRRSARIGKRKGSNEAEA